MSPASRRLTQAIRIAAAVAAGLEFGFKSLLMKDTVAAVATAVRSTTIIQMHRFEQ